ncbi:MAG: cell wall biogenesis protein [Waddliaceae bacterium]|nr:cell wall biogenesis protein [Waddliaceae bacterium]
MIQTIKETIPYVDLAAEHVSIKDELLEAVKRVIEHGQFILGPEVEAFEKAFAQICGTNYAVGVNSGTDALILALKALGIGTGDEVITVPNSFIATTAAICLTGAQPKFVDVNEQGLMDPSLLEAQVNEKTKALLPVHLSGLPCDMNRIKAFCKKHKLFLIEDAAQAILAEYQGQRVGSFGDIGCFSLHPLKTLNACGDGGVLTFNNPELYEKILMLRNLGLKNRDQAILWSSNSRLDTMQAAILLVKLRYLAEWTEKRREHALAYNQSLNGIEGLKLPQEDPSCLGVYHTYVVRAARRDALQEYLEKQGIGSKIHYPIPIHLQEAAKDLGYKRGDFPVCEREAQNILSLPIYPDLKEEQREQICAAIREFYGEV